jgi:Protein of unknown function (DUF3887)
VSPISDGISALNRRREHDVKYFLTAGVCQVHLYKMSEIAASARAAVRTAQDIAALAAGRPIDQDEKSAALALIAHALSLVEQADTVTASAVAAARNRGCTWQDIGNLLGTTRQAAFQRFGRPIDPRTGTPMLRTRAPLADRNARDVLSSLTEGKWEHVSKSFNATMIQGLPDTMLADNWASLIAQFGQFESAQTPTVRQQGLHTVVDIPVAFEAGDIVMRVSYQPDGLIAGLYFRNPDKPTTHRDEI